MSSLLTAAAAMCRLAEEQEATVAAARPVHREPYCEVMQCATRVHTGTADRAVQRDVSRSSHSSDDLDQEAVAVVVAAAAAAAALR
jgi:hypothetical protein